jgi:hypothetical protein
MPSTSVARSIDSSGAVEACGPKQNIGGCHVGVDRRRCRRKHDERRREAIGVKACDDIVDRQLRGGGVDNANVASIRTQQRREQRQRIRRLRRAEHVFALLAAALPREGDAVDERRIDEKRPLPEHAFRHR